MLKQLMSHFEISLISSQCKILVRDTKTLSTPKIQAVSLHKTL